MLGLYWDNSTNGKENGNYYLEETLMLWNNPIDPDRL